MKFLRSKIITILLLAILIIVGIFLYKYYLEKRKLGLKYDYLQSKIVKLDAENQNLEMQMADLENPEKMEGAARKLYVLTKPGEKAIIIPHDLLNTPPELDLSRSNKGIWGLILDFFRPLFK